MPTRAACAGVCIAARTKDPAHLLDLRFLDLRPLDLYCERVDASLWSEPLNAASNLAFLLAAWLTWRRGKMWDQRLLALLAALVGVCSLTFHLVAQVWAAWADMLAILAFIYAYLWRYMVRVAHAPWLGVSAAIAVYAGCDFLRGRLFAPETLNGSIPYVPALAALVLMSAYAATRNATIARPLAAAAAVFTLSLTLRTMDLAVCNAWPIGTHFLWHMGNALVLYLVAGALTRGEAVARYTTR